jgi:hypothetical protein
MCSDVILLEKRVINRQDRAAGIAKHDFYTLFPEGRDYDLGAGHQACFGLLFGFDGHDFALASGVRKEGVCPDSYLKRKRAPFGDPFVRTPATGSDELRLRVPNYEYL